MSLQSIRQQLMFKYILFEVVILCKIVAEIRFVCPRPQRPDSSLTEPSCGKHSFRKSFESEYTEVYPGPLTLHWEDTVFVPGSPSRVSLGQWGNSPHCVLVDHIPQRNKYVGKVRQKCHANEYPLGSCHSSRYLTVNIPDIQCEKCYLQLMAVTPQDGGICVEDKITRKVNCTTFYSCANIRIRSSLYGSKKTLLHCKDYLSNLMGYWPYIETVVRKAVITESIFGNSSVSVSLDKYYLEYHINLMGSNLRIHTLRDKMSIVIKPRASTVYVILLETLILSGKFPAFGDLIKMFQEDKLAVRFELSFSSKAYYIFDLKVSGSMYKPGVYSHHTDSYDNHGWLNSSNFRGSSAVYPYILNPVGQCAPFKQSYSALLRDNDNNLHAIISHIPLVNAFHISALFSKTVLYGKPVVYKLQGSMTDNGEIIIPFEIFNDNLVKSSVVDVNYNESHKLSHATSIVSIMNIPALLRGDVHKSIKTQWIEDNEIYAAYGVIIPSNGDTWWATVMIINKGLNPIEISASVYIAFPTLNITVASDKKRLTNRWVGNAGIKIKNSTIPNYLWMAYASLHVTLNHSSHIVSFPSMPFEPLTEWHCEELISAGCWRASLLPLGGWTSMNRVVEVYGSATFYIPRATTSLLYTVTLTEMMETESLANMSLSHADGTFLTSLSYGTPVYNTRKSVTIDGMVDLNADILKAVKSELTHITVRTTHSVVSGKIPIINQVITPVTSTVSHTASPPFGSSQPNYLSKFSTSFKTRSPTGNTESVASSRYIFTDALIQYLFLVYFTSY